MPPHLYRILQAFTPAHFTLVQRSPAWQITRVSEEKTLLAVSATLLHHMAMQVIVCHLGVPYCTLGCGNSGHFVIVITHVGFADIAALAMIFAALSSIILLTKELSHGCQS